MIRDDGTRLPLYRKNFWYSLGIKVDWQTEQNQYREENHQMGEFFPLTKKRLRENQEYKKQEILTSSWRPQGSVVAPILFLIYV